MASMNVTWDKVPTQLIRIIGNKIDSYEDFLRFSAVCKTWQSVMFERKGDEKILFLSPESPLLLLAEKVDGCVLSCNINNDEDEEGYKEDVDEEVEEAEEKEEEESEEEEEEEGEDEEEDEEESEEEDEEEGEEEDGDENNDGYEEEEEEEDDDGEDYVDHGDQIDSGDEDMEMDEEESGDEDIGMGGDEDMNVDGDANMGIGQELHWAEDDGDQYLKRYYQLKVSVGCTRGIYSLSTGKLYTIELPEAANKLILGANKGMLLTLGKDFSPRLLHPLLRQEISLPSMHVFRVGNEYISYGGEYINFVQKVAMSFQVQQNKNVLRNDRPDPTVMIIYEENGYLGFARPRDNLWTKVDVPWSSPFTDIVYHRGKFYSINCRGDTFICHIDHGYTSVRHATGTQIAECPLIEHADTDFDRKYLVGSRCDLWLVVRLRRIKRFRPPNHTRVKYGTTDFLVWKLEHKISEDGLGTVCAWSQRKTLDNMAFFVGRNSSVSLPSSGCINPNCIYFTDDARDLYYPDGGGHDMGVYNVESSTIVPHFQGKSIHHVSPPLWYI